ncbi:MAG: TMEM165/GDT1 family protein [Promethearchaeota archaeon]
MEWIILFLTFGILFLGELGDKTQLIVFNLALEHKKSYKVGIGATIGFGVIVTIGVFFGTLITSFIPIFIVTIISGIIFIIIGILETRNLKKLYQERKRFRSNESIEKKEEVIEKTANENLPPILRKLKKNPYVAGFSFIFLMELGDKTQILTITLASLYPHPFEVWLGSFLALTALAWIGVFFGAAITQKIPKFHLKLVSALIFIFIGFLILIMSLFI